MCTVHHTVGCMHTLQCCTVQYHTIPSRQVWLVVADDEETADEERGEEMWWWMILKSTADFKVRRCIQYS